MRTICQACETAYTIPDDRIGPKGRKVRCTRCGEEWRVYRTAEAEDAPEIVSDIDAEFAGAEGGEPMGQSAVDDLFGPLSNDKSTEPVGASGTAEDAFAGFDMATTDEADGEVAENPDVADEADPVAAMEAAAEPEAAAKPTAAPAAARTAKPKRGPVYRRRLFHLPHALEKFTPFFGPAVFASACLAVAGLVVFRAPVVTRVPSLAGFYRMVGLEVNLRGMVFGPIETLRETEDGKPVLVVEGSIANTTAASRDVPALRFALRDGDAQELYVWSVDPRATTIAAGETVKFRTRLVAPPDRAAELQVRFAERRNRQAGLP